MHRPRILVIENLLSKVVVEEIKIICSLYFIEKGLFLFKI